MCETQVPDVEYETMTPGDWQAFLREHPDLCLVVNAPDGVHTFHYERHEDAVMFLAHGQMGYDEAGTQAALETVAEQSAGLNIQTREETYG